MLTPVWHLLSIRYHAIDTAFRMKHCFSHQKDYFVAATSQYVMMLSIKNTVKFKRCDALKANLFGKPPGQHSGVTETTHLRSLRSDRLADIAVLRHVVEMDLWVLMRQHRHERRLRVGTHRRGGGSGARPARVRGRHRCSQRLRHQSEESLLRPCVVSSIGSDMVNVLRSWIGNSYRSQSTSAASCKNPTRDTAS